MNKKLKKALDFFRSMRFGMILLVLIAVLSVFGTLIAQGQTGDYYRAANGNAAGLILFLGLDHLYSTWYYAGLFALLCVNLACCSALRVSLAARIQKAIAEKARRAAPDVKLAPEAAKTYLSSHGFKEREGGVWMRNRFGAWGSFVAHLGLLLLLIASACTFMLEVRENYTVMIGEQIVLSDGTALHVDDFTLTDAEGNIEYRSTLEAVTADGQLVTGDAMVNHPVRFGRYSVYQQSYAFAGVLDVSTVPGDPGERVLLEDTAFISLDGVNGVSYLGNYGDFALNEDGQLVPASHVEGGHNAYLINVIHGGEQGLTAATVDETFEVAGVYYTFREPQAYPGLLVKSMPGWVLPLLYSSFAILLVGLWLCFFHIPMAAFVGEAGLAVAAQKDISDWVDEMKENLANG